MPDHLHWLMTLVAGEGLSSLVGRFKGRTARVVNVHRGLSGRVWQPGFHDRAIRDETDLHGAFVYIVENTVRAGLVSRPEDYPFWGTIAEPAVPATVRRGLWPDPCPGRYRA
jgi:REP element-mobilizing transposase RayT